MYNVPVKLRSSISFYVKKYTYLYFLIAITFIGVIFRIHNLSPFKFYPDTYQNLLVAHNISTYHSVIGYLGKNGMLYPDIVMWTRPGYSLLILLLNFFVHNTTLAAQIISISLGAVSIPLIYVAIRYIFKNRIISLIGSFLLALSFNHIVWSGFIMTETTGVFFILLTLILLFVAIQKPSKYASIHDLLVGVMFGAAVLSRYEYVVLLLPIIYLIWVKTAHPLPRIINFMAAFLFVLSIIAAQIIPVAPFAFSAVRQLAHMIVIGVVMLVVFVSLCIEIHFSSRLRLLITKKISVVLLSCIYLIAAIMSLQIVFHLSFLYEQLYAMRVFFKFDFLIGLAFIVGITYLLRSKKQKTVAVFILLSMFLLGFIYYRTNPEMQRYWTHLLPFILIPASVGVYRVGLFLNQLFITHRYKLFLAVLMSCFVLVLLQIMLSYLGMHNWANGAWFRTSYEEKAAGMIKKYIPNKNALIIASFPEPYYYFTNTSTYSITDNYPFVYIDSSLSDRTILIVQDKGMEDQFPAFSRFLTRHLQKYQIASLWVNEPYHYGPWIYKSTEPVKLYTIKLKQLNNEVVKSTKH